jgi:hypothetical protein
MPDTGRGPLLISYYVTEERTAHADGATFLVDRVQRLDPLNRLFALSGYTSPHLGAAFVVVDMIERDVLARVTPALAKDASAPVVDDATRRSQPPWASPLEKRAGDVLRAEYPVYGSAELDAVVTLLTRREALYERFATSLALSNVEMLPPVHLVERAPLDALEGRALASELREWADINDQLDEKASRRAFGALVDVMARRIDRHEVQHQIDFRRGALGIPADVRALLGIPDTLELSPGDDAVRVRDELSAELAALASAGPLGGTCLVLATGSFFDRDDWSTPYAYSGAVLLWAVARELGVGEASPYHDGTIDRAAGAELFAGVAAHRGAEIAQAAARAYARVFGTPVADVTMDPWVASPPWSR